MALRRTTLSLSLIIALLVSGVAAFYSYRTVNFQSRQNEVAKKDIIQLIEFHLSNYDYEGVVSVARLALQRQDIEDIAVIDSFGFAVFGDKQKLEQPSNIDAENELATYPLYAPNQSETENRDAVGQLYLIRTNAYWSEAVKVVGSGSAAFLIMFTSSYFLVKYHVSRFVYVPLSEFTRAMEKTVNSGEPSTVNYDSDTPMGRLAKTFNSMQIKIDKSRQSLVRERNDRSNQLAAINLILKSSKQSLSIFDRTGTVIYSSVDNIENSIIQELSRTPVYNLDQLQRLIFNIDTDFEIQERSQDQSEETLYSADIFDLEGNTFHIKALRIPGDDLAIFSSDVTDQRSIEKRIQHTRKREALGSLTSGVAHEFNNMLAIMLSNAELELLAPSDDRTKIKERLETIMHAGNRASQIVSQLLKWTRQDETGSVVLDLNLHLPKIKPLIASTLGPHIDLKIEVDGDCCVKVNASEFDATLVNLAKNSKDAMPQGGAFKISAKRGSGMVDKEKKETVLLTVSDTGCGMSTEALDKMFDPFFTTKPSGQGTGLGLSAVLGFVERSGAKIDVNSKLKQGTEFKFTFQHSAEKAAKFIHDESLLAPPETKTRCLLVDDEEQLAKNLAGALVFVGYDLIVATSVNQALEQLETSQFDVLICDLSLRDGNGITVLKNADENTRKIVITGNPSEFPEIEKIADVVLIKPFSISTLISKIKQL